MAKPQNKTHQTNRFLACFGFSGKKNSTENNIKTRIKHKSTSLSGSTMFCFSSKKFGTKTVPVVDNSDKGDFRCESKTKPTHKKADRQLSSLDKASRAKPKEGPEPNILLGDPTRTGSSLRGSPTVKPKPNPKTPSKLSHSVSLPVLQGNQRAGNPGSNDGMVEKFDPVMGLFIIMVTLVILLVWGRICAILCISAWFYFRPRFQTTTINCSDIKNIDGSSDLDLDLDLKEYKKKIVLEGLLERNRKVT